MNINNDLFEKCRTFEDAKFLINAGVYPFFRPIEDSEGSSVVTHGAKRVMIGSNNYLGLTHHPKVKEAAKAAKAATRRPSRRSSASATEESA